MQPIFPAGRFSWNVYDYIEIIIAVCPPFASSRLYHSYFFDPRKQVFYHYRFVMSSTSTCSSRRGSESKPFQVIEGQLDQQKLYDFLKDAYDCKTGQNFRVEVGVYHK